MCRACARLTGAELRSGGEIERDDRLTAQADAEPREPRTLTVGGKEYEVVWDGSRR
jgi:hypothetical protein